MAHINRNQREEIGRRKALIIGLSDYEKLQSLDFCIRDGESMTDMLRSLEYYVPTENVIVGNIEGENLRKVILDFFITDTVEEDDTLLFYFSGHGVLDSDGDGYLCSSDIDPDSPIRKGFAFDDLTNIMNKSRSKKIVLLLDCCYSGTARISKGKMISPAELGKTAIQKSSKALRHVRGRCILAACSGTEEAYILREYGQSIFTYYIIKGLEGNENSIDNMGNVTIDTLADFVSKTIMSLPKHKRLNQTPLKKVESSIEIVLASYPQLARSLETNIINLLFVGRIAEFNNFRSNTSSYIILNFGRTNLSGKNLAGANLSHSFMQQVNLQDSNLNNASLERSKLTRANLRAANLEDANMQGAKLSRVKLNEATLSKVTMKNAELEKAELFGANLTQANLQQCNLQNSILTEAILRNADCSESNFSYSYLENADLTGANLQGANFMFAEMTGAIFAFANMVKADLSRAELVGNDLSKVILENSILTDAYLSDAILRCSNLKNAEMIRIDLQGASLENADLTGANLQGASLENADLTGANLQGANLQGASLENADLTGANLQGANFMFAQIEGARLDDADRRGAIGLNP
jgi:uncharacterized protein YjbI with pentapeptide repeats